MKLLFFQVFTVTCAAFSQSNVRGRGGGGFGFGGKREQGGLETVQVDKSQPVTDLISFVRENGGSCGKKAVIGTSKGSMRGLMCTEKIKEGEIICRVPSNIALALSDPSSSDVSHAAAGAVNYLDWYLNSPKMYSFFSRYIASLPKLADGEKAFTPTPDFFKESEIEMIEFPPMMSTLKERMERTEEAAKDKGVELEIMR